MEITEEQRKNGIQIRGEYKQKIAPLQKQIAEYKGTITELIAEYKGTITELKDKIGGLEKQIADAMPRLDGAEMLCDKCEIISMKYTGTVPGQGERERWYRCVVCDCERYHT